MYVVGSLDHVAITVRDMDESVEFYTKLLGLSVTRRMETSDANIVYLQAGEIKIELFGLKKEKTIEISYLGIAYFLQYLYENKRIDLRK